MRKPLKIFTFKFLKLVNMLPFWQKGFADMIKLRTLRWEDHCGLWSGSNMIPVQLSHSVLSDSLWPHGQQHTRPPCPSPAPRVYSNSHPLSPMVAMQPTHPLLSPSPIAFPVSGSLQMSQFFESGGQTIGVSASTSVLPINIQDRFPLGLTCLISFQSKGLSRLFSNTTVQSINSLVLSFPYGPTLTSIHDHWKNHSLD